MVGIGINDNIVISAAGFDDKGRLSIELKQVTAGEASPFEQFQTAGYSKEGSNNLKYNFLKFLTPNKPDQTKAQRVGLVTDDMKRFKNVLTQLLEQYMTTDSIDFQTTMFDNTGISDTDSYTSRIIDQDVLDKIYKNLCNRFIALITPYLGNEEYLLRFKLARQSKDKAYAKIPDRYIEDRPFVELMTVPKEHSRVKFDKWEIDNGLNSSTPVSKDTAESKGATAANTSHLPDPFAAPTHEVSNSSPFSA